MAFKGSSGLLGHLCYILGTCRDVLGHCPLSLKFLKINPCSSFHQSRVLEPFSPVLFSLFFSFGGGAPDRDRPQISHLFLWNFAPVVLNVLYRLFHLMFCSLYYFFSCFPNILNMFKSLTCLFVFSIIPFYFYPFLLIFFLHLFISVLSVSSSFLFLLYFSSYLPFSFYYLLLSLTVIFIIPIQGTFSRYLFLFMELYHQNVIYIILLISAFRLTF